MKEHSGYTATSCVLCVCLGQFGGFLSGLQGTFWLPSGDAYYSVVLFSGYKICEKNVFFEAIQNVGGRVYRLFAIMPRLCTHTSIVQNLTA
jgi:hypothetical protein